MKCDACKAAFKPAQADMTVEDVRSHLKAIRDHRHDPEGAHALEDTMRESVLLAIATGRCVDPKACAAEALKSNEIAFDRWYT